jgi:hypothetical protein
MQTSGGTPRERISNLKGDGGGRRRRVEGGERKADGRKMDE